MSGKSLQQPAGRFPPGKLQRIGAAAGTVSALIHLFSAIGGLLMPEIPASFYGEAAFQVSTFFLGLGVFQLAWVWVLLRSGNRLLLAFGVLGYLGSILIYFVSLGTPLPFGVPQQRITESSAFAFTTKIVEVVFVGSSLSLLKTRVRTS